MHYTKYLNDILGKGAAKLSLTAEAAPFGAPEKSHVASGPRGVTQTTPTTDRAGSNTLAVSVTKMISAYVAAHEVSYRDLAELIDDVSRALSQSSSSIAEGLKAEPSVPVSKSVHRDYIVCLEDGRKFKSLKRHLRVRYGLTPDEYRDKWDLPPSYPMVAPSYTEKRSALARQARLGYRKK